MKFGRISQRHDMTCRPTALRAVSKETLLRKSHNFWQMARGSTAQMFQQFQRKGCPWLARSYLALKFR